MTLHYRALPDPTGVVLGPLPVPTSAQTWAETGLAAVPLPALAGAYARFGKRSLDLLLGSLAAFLAAPVLLLLAVALWIESGNPFYTQERLGLNGRRFRMFKLRTMVRDADGKLAACLDADPELRRDAVGGRREERRG